ncbi:MAG: GIY-YIG nuclease family protein [Patescibacteria group bacterium]
MKSSTLIYIGISNNIERRLKQHNNGVVRSTKFKRPWLLIHKENFLTYSHVRKRELLLKSLKKRSAIERLIKHF